MLGRVLDQYGLEDREQQAALIELLKLTGAFSKQQFDEDFAACNFDVGAWLVRVTQREFFARKPGQERWEQPKLTWLEKNKPLVLNLIDKLGLGEAKLPNQTQYDFIAIFGSTYYDMCARFDFIRELVDEGKVIAKQLYFLTGERYASKMADGDAANELMTERQIMELAYQQIKRNGTFAQLPITVIDTNRNDKHRPNTKMTLYDFFDVLPEKRNTYQTGLFVSSAPDILPQHEAVLTVLKDLNRSDVIAETVGSATEILPAQRAIGALAGAWYERSHHF